MTRRHPLRTADYLRHIHEAIEKIQSYTSGMEAAGFKVDRKTQDAVIRNLEVIGEACNNVVRHDPILLKRTRMCLGASPMKCETH